MLTAPPVWAQTDAPAGERYFHRAAQQYIAENLSDAQRLVAEGLRAAPDHPKLLALREKLRQQQKRRSGADDANGQNGSAQQSGGQQQNQQQARPQPGDAQQQRSRGQQTADRRGSRGSQPPPEDAQQAQGERSSAAARQPLAQQRAEGSSDRRPTGLSRDQAARILQALEGQEKQLLREVQKRASAKTTVEKDW
jgi:hypothetical protein